MYLWKFFPPNGEVKHKTVSWACQAWLAVPPGESVFMPNCFPSLRAKGKWFHSCNWIQRSWAVSICPTRSTVRCVWAWQTVECIMLTGPLPETQTKIQIFFWSFKMLPSHHPLYRSSYFVIQTLSHPFSPLSLKFFKGYNLGSPVILLNIKSSIPKDSAPQDIWEQEVSALDAFQTPQLSQVRVLGEMG